MNLGKQSKGIVMCQNVRQNAMFYHCKANNPGAYFIKDLQLQIATCSFNLIGRFHGNGRGGRPPPRISHAFPWKRPMSLKLQVAICNLQFASVLWNRPQFVVMLRTSCMQKTEPWLKLLIKNILFLTAQIFPGLQSGPTKRPYVWIATDSSNLIESSWNFAPI